MKLKMTQECSNWIRIFFDIHKMCFYKKSNLTFIYIIIKETYRWYTADKGAHAYKSGADLGFQVRGAHLKKLCRAEGGAKIFRVFRVKNHDFMPTNHIFSNCGGRRESFWSISCEKSRFYAKKSYFFQF
jgi:hypothetical protein